jgi:hypothetical protein
MNALSVNNLILPRPKFVKNVPPFLTLTHNEFKMQDLSSSPTVVTILQNASID